MVRAKKPFHGRKAPRNTSKPSRGPPAHPTCIVCSEPSTKNYKCPRCRVPYCSLPCAKAHKSNCTGTPPENFSEINRNKTKRPKTKPSPLLLSAEERTTALRRGEWREWCELSEDVRRKLDGCDWLREMLSESGKGGRVTGLREVIRNVVGGCDNKDGNDEWDKTVSRLIDAKDTNGDFGDFLENILREVGATKEENGEVVFCFDAGTTKDTSKMKNWIKREDSSSCSDESDGSDSTKDKDSSSIHEMDTSSDGSSDDDSDSRSAIEG